MDPHPEHERRAPTPTPAPTSTPTPPATAEPSTPPGLRAVLARLRRDGMLLLADPRRPSLVALVAGAPVRGSWWSHPRGREIYALAQELAAHRDVLVVKWIDGKVTFVHRRGWPTVLARATASDPERTRGLTAAARALLARVEAAGTVEASGTAVRELEGRLLVHAAQVHTERGAHATVLTSWKRWIAEHAASRPSHSKRATRTKAARAKRTDGNERAPAQRAGKTDGARSRARAAAREGSSRAPRERSRGTRRER